MINRKFFIERNGSGTMIKLLDDNTNASLADYKFYNSADLVNNIPAGRVHLLKPGIVFQPNEIYTVHLTGYVNAVNTATVNLSPIAYYVYWMMVKDLTQQQSALGVQTRPKAENAEIVSPAPTMVNVWNKMVELSRSLTDFLNANSSTYSSYSPAYYYGNCSQNELLVKINLFGI